jgi:hypothetical protein
MGRVSFGAALHGFGGAIDGGLPPNGPEPTTLAPLGLGLVGIAAMRRRRSELARFGAATRRERRRRTKKACLGQKH